MTVTSSTRKTIVVRMIILANSHRNVCFLKPFNSFIVQIPYAFCNDRSAEEGAGVDQVVHSLDHYAGAPFGFIGADLLEERFSFAQCLFD